MKQGTEPNTESQQVEENITAENRTNKSKEEEAIQAIQNAILENDQNPDQC